jgi:hypothetical protein
MSSLTEVLTAARARDRPAVAYALERLDEAPPLDACRLATLGNDEMRAEAERKVDARRDLDMVCMLCR